MKNVYLMKNVCCSWAGFTQGLSETFAHTPAQSQYHAKHPSEGEFLYLTKQIPQAKPVRDICNFPEAYKPAGDVPNLWPPLQTHGELPSLCRLSMHCSVHCKTSWGEGLVRGSHPLHLVQSYVLFKIDQLLCYYVCQMGAPSLPHKFKSTRVCVTCLAFKVKLALNACCLLCLSIRGWSLCLKEAPILPKS